MEVEVKPRPRWLKCSVQNYDWGRKGEDSTVGSLFSKNSRAELEMEKPYAELWMGTHGSGPSFLVKDDACETTTTATTTLKSWIGENPNVLLGERVRREWGSDLPFLFKVLSVAKALSIQAHPDKELAAVLHKMQPGVYKDDNHKPEMAVAITEFRALCGFVSLEARMLTEKETLALELEKQYPADVGVISSFFFNYVKLNPGEALYLGPNEPHAYISGECVECMATSDNVVRAGLTPKFRDVQTLCSMLTYKQGFPKILKGFPLNSYVSRYAPPFDEFEVDCCSLPSKESVDFPAVPGPSLFLILSGEGEIQFDFSKEKDVIMDGDVLFVPAETQITISSGVGGSLKLYRAGVNRRFFE